MGFVIVICNFLFCYEVYISFRKYFTYPTARSATTENLTEIVFPKIIIGHTSGYDESILKSLGYDSLFSFTTDFGWIGNNKSSVEDVFERSYTTPSIQNLIRNDSFLKVNGKDRKQLIWKEKPMIYPEGKCLELDLNRAPSSETTPILKL